MKTIRMAAVVLVSVRSLVAQVQPTPTWTDFYSQATTLNGQAVPVGALVRALDPQGVVCGEYRVQTAGWYGYLHVYGDDATTPGVDEGAVNGDTITFRIEGLPAVRSAPAVWMSGNPGALVEVHLHAVLPAPPSPQLMRPLDGAGEVPLAVVLRWAPAPEPYPSIGVLTNRIQVARDSGFSNVVVDSARSGMDSLRIERLASGGVYYWWVRYEHSLSGSGPYSAARKFTTTTTRVEDVADFPGGFELEQNYPNPFNAETRIEYQIPVGSRQMADERRVRLSVFDIHGREVAVLVNDIKPPGTYTAAWNASGLPTGVYFIRLQNGENVSTKKALLLR